MAHKRELERVSDPRKKHTDWPRKIIGLRIGDSLKFSKEGSRD